MDNKILIPINLKDIENIAQKIVNPEFKYQQEFYWRLIEKDLYDKWTEKACNWLYKHLYTLTDVICPSRHFTCSKQMLTQTEFVELFRKAMKGE